jgi:hypothetical protein
MVEDDVKKATNSNQLCIILIIIKKWLEAVRSGRFLGDVSGGIWNISLKIQIVIAGPLHSTRASWPTDLL